MSCDSCMRASPSIRCVMRSARYALRPLPKSASPLGPYALATSAVTRLHESALSATASYIRAKSVPLLRSNPCLLLR